MPAGIALRAGWPSDPKNVRDSFQGDLKEWLGWLVADPFLVLISLSTTESQMPRPRVFCEGGGDTANSTDSEAPFVVHAFSSSPLRLPSGQVRGTGKTPALTRAFRPPTLKSMEVQLSSDQAAFIRQAVASGRFAREEDAVREALAQWEERERRRAEFLATLDDAKASLARGEGRVITEQSMRELTEEVEQRGLARLASDRPAPR